ncbi:MAG: NAD-dependent epimerase/dehydratase family protein [Gemmatimonadales bacterium]
MISRRRFIETGAAAAGALRFGSRRPRAPLDLLILGGTGFIGPHLVRDAVGRGHRVTTFTRGRRQVDLPAGVLRLTGDRNGQLQALEGKRYDAVVDDSATNPEWVRLSTELLRGRVGRYLFTSSTGVYYPYLRRGLTEADPVRLEIRDTNDPSESYGVRKAQCERQVLDSFGERGLVVRPTYIVGPGDTSDRFPYWPVRLARGGPTLAPGDPNDPVQLVDVRDLTAFMLDLIESGKSGIYNAAGPGSALTFGEFLSRAARAVDSSSRFVWVGDHERLKAHGIDSAVPWIMLEGNDDGHTSIDNSRARRARLRFRPLEETVRDTLAWWPSLPEARRAKPRFTISAEAEAALLGT